MILVNLPSPGVNLESQKLRTSAWKAICSVELAAQSGAASKSSRADELRDFFIAAAQACNAVAVTTKTITSV